MFKRFFKTDILSIFNARVYACFIVFQHIKITIPIIIYCFPRLQTIQSVLLYCKTNTFLHIYVCIHTHTRLFACVYIYIICVIQYRDRG